MPQRDPYAKHKSPVGTRVLAGVVWGIGGFIAAGASWAAWLTDWFTDPRGFSLTSVLVTAIIAGVLSALLGFLRHGRLD